MPPPCRAFASSASWVSWAAPASTAAAASAAAAAADAAAAAAAAAPDGHGVRGRGEVDGDAREAAARPS